MGLPFYGRTFITKLDGNFGDMAGDVGFQGVYTRENGFMGYNEICVLLSDRTSGWNKSYDHDMHQAIAKYKDEETGEMRVAVFDNSRSIATKMKFAMSRNLAGAMVWSIDTDDFHGDCDIDNVDTFADFPPIPGFVLNVPKRYNANYPLLRTINEATVMALDDIAHEKENEILNESDDFGKGTAATTIQTAYFTIFTVLCLHFYHLRN